MASKDLPSGFTPYVGNTVIPIYTVQWQNGSFIDIAGAKGTAIGTGKANTEAIVLAQGTGIYAAKLCADLVLGGYDDWFLPSKDELNLMYTNLKVPSLGGFVDGFYWSSSQHSSGSAWSQSFSDGSQNSSPTTSLNYVRAVRAF